MASEILAATGNCIDTLPYRIMFANSLAHCFQTA